MKRLIPFIILTFSLFLLNSCFKANDNVGHDGRCTGSAYCTACSNCSRCGHCSSGGTCGVCGGGSGSNSSSGSSAKRSKSKKNKSSDSYKASKTKSNKPPKVFIDKVNVNVNSNRYIAGISTTNIYEKPSFKSKIIAIVPKNTKLIQVSKQNSWYKVKKDGKMGYVHYKDIK
ncbi:SH3 domain-containing protein [Chryseobacterium camelliae]|uniref:SH3 domain-containing protein n=1 Tax=Chryseobacterium camelliae TaxID=1265445 RepID=A0ABY7QHX9_9FLAO|nr:SH3 domain-containing protein [Chryseobacterium camelliae]WBV59209.1 SH3 domain-containing protein [Chryseobacterium camelliae]